MPRARDAVICLEIFRPPRREQTPFLTNTCIYRRGIKSWNTSGKIRARKLTDSPILRRNFREKRECDRGEIDRDSIVPNNNTIITIKKKSAFNV